MQPIGQRPAMQGAWAAARCLPNMNAASYLTHTQAGTKILINMLLLYASSLIFDSGPQRQSINEPATPMHEILAQTNAHLDMYRQTPPLLPPCKILPYSLPSTTYYI